MRTAFWSILLFCIWMILSSNLQTSNLILGSTISIALAFLYTKLFVHELFKIPNPFWFFIYIIILIKNLIISNIKIAKRVLSKDMCLKPKIVEVKTSLKSDWKKLLLANSITLTPGTLTLDIKENTLKIHIIEFNDGYKKEDITKEFENIISKI